MNFWILTLATLLTAGPAFATTDGHPMAGTMVRLSQIADELKGFSSHPGRDNFLTVTINILTRKAGDLQMRALRLPIRQANKKLNHAGYDFKCMNAILCWQYTLQENDQIEKFKNELKNFNASAALDFLTIVEEDEVATKLVARSLNNHDYTRAMTYQDRQIVEAMTDNARFSDLNKLKEIAQKNIECIDYFTAAEGRSGLVAVEVSPNEFAWSAPALKKKYGQTKISDLSGSQKRSVIGELSEMSQQAYETDFSCIGFPKARFYGETKETLEKDLKP